MDKRKICLLKYLSKNCGDDYKVLDTKKILSSLKKYKGNFDTLKKDIMYFSRRKYIDLKYFDQDNVCLSVQDNLHILEENLKVEEGLRKKFVTMLTIFSIVSCATSFLGAFLAIILVRW